MNKYYHNILDVSIAKKVLASQKRRNPSLAKRGGGDFPKICLFNYGFLRLPIKVPSRFLGYLIVNPPGSVPEPTLLVTMTL